MAQPKSWTKAWFQLKGYANRAEYVKAKHPYFPISTGQAYGHPLKNEAPLSLFLRTSAEAEPLQSVDGFTYDEVNDWVHSDSFYEYQDYTGLSISEMWTLFVYSPTRA